MTPCLRDEPLPVCIPIKVLKFPQEWCMNDGYDHKSAPDPTYQEIADMEGYLTHFTRFAQIFLTRILCSLLPNDAAVITCHGHTFGLREIMRAAKYGSPSAPDMQQSVLELLAAAAKSVGFSLGEVKALVYVASLEGIGYMGVSPNTQAEMVDISMSRRLLRTRWFGNGSVKYAWGGDLSQFKPILEKTLDFVQNEVVLPKS